MKHNKNTFWTLNRHHAEGFTLVELIVVIAILAILGGVAVPAYSGYVTRANMGADETLVSEIYRALTLAIYDDYTHEFADTIVVKLSTTESAKVESLSGNATDADIALAENAMAAAFGENWAETCKLSYGEWAVDSSNVTNYKESSYYGNEDELLSTVSNLSGALARFFATGRNVPAQIQKILDKNGISSDNSTGVANSTVMALASNLTEAGSTVQDEIVNALIDVQSCWVINDEGFKEFDLSVMTGSINESYGKYYGELQDDGTYLLDEDATDMVRLASTATLYAYAEGFSQYASKNGDNTPANILSGIKYTDDAGNALNSVQIALNVNKAFEDIVAHATQQNQTLANNYFFSTDSEGKTASSKDAEAFFAMMDSVDQSADTLSSDLTSADCFANAGGLIRGYVAAGSVLADGEAGVIINQDKSIVGFLDRIIKWD